MKLTLSDRINFGIVAIKKHGFLLTMGLAFLGIGCFLIYLGIKNNNNIPLLVAGGFVILFMTFFLGYTMPSSLSFYYEKAIVKKYGSYTTASVIGKHVEDQSYEERIDNRVDNIELLFYIIDYKYTYQEEYFGSFYVTNKACFEAIEIGSDIPIKFLKHKPEQAKPRRQKLCKDLGLETNMCN
ncbi:hypothetical protein [Winogradskyella flava]|uniref:Uncharacterized protein n=1 Tax=Winogradskyella flava TaxID=1884876 RepID=A0A842IXF7_9FLAO|nr:hypothetical protein [Winogradskyella flava]MBC2845977.1 hypothetical protein [Winogradskyella flava]